MTGNNCRHLTVNFISRLFCITAVFLISKAVAAQQKDSTACLTTPGFSCYRSATQKTTDTLYYKYSYRQPAHELMYWPNYPQTADQAAQMLQRQKEEQKPGRQLIRHIVTDAFKKKTPVAVQPRF